MSALVEQVPLEKASESPPRETAVVQPSSTLQPDTLDSLADRLFGAGVTGGPDATAWTLAIPGLRAPLMKSTQRAYGNQVSQRLMMRATAFQRQCACGGACNECQARRLEEEQSAKQRKSAASASADFDLIPTGEGYPLARAARAPLETYYQTDLSDVRVHTDSGAAQSAETIDALAYTSGRDIYFSPGTYAPGSRDGQRLLAHEVAHVVQHSAGAQPAIAAKSEHGLKIAAPDDPLELEADRAAEEFTAGDEGVQMTEQERKRLDPSGNRHAIQTKSRKTSTREASQRIGTTSTTDTPVFRQTTASPGTPGGSDPCLDRLRQIIELLNEVARRIREALDDKNDLFKFRPGPNPEVPEGGTWDGHRDRFYYDRDRLRHKIAEWESNDDCRGYRLSRQQQEDLNEAYEFKEKEFPERPAPSMRTTDEEPSFREKIAEALKKAGIPAWAVAALIVLIIAAIADPEPFSKVALLIGAAAAVIFFIAIGRPNDVPPSA